MNFWKQSKEIYDTIIKDLKNMYTKKKRENDF